MRKGWGLASLAAGGLAVGGLLFSGARGDISRQPAARPNPSARLPEIVESNGVRRVKTTHPAEVVVLDSVMPNGGAEILWLAGRAATGTPLGQVVLDAAGGPVRFDGRLRAERLRFRLDGREPASVAWDGADGLWVTTREGSVLRLGPDGSIADSVPPPYDYTFVAADPRGEVLAVRSPVQFSYPFLRVPEPLFVRVAGRAEHPVVPARAPRVSLFVHLVNAGRIAPAGDGSVYYAPFIRDEVVKFSPEGDTLWVASRGLPHGVEEPSFEVVNGEPVLDYAPVNVGLKLGPDGMLYALATPGSTTAETRLDVIDPESGVVLRSAEIGTGLPTLAADSTGRVYLLDEFRLLTGVSARERDAVAAFDLERLGGGRMTSSELLGKVTLINFWASWCAPCRAEMPALDSLRRDLERDEDFRFIAISDDVSTGEADAFIEELGFDFTVLYGRGRMRSKYHYFGLPFTILVDRSGKVANSWAGYAGEAQIAALRATIRAELDRGAGREPAAHHHGGDSAGEGGAEAGGHGAHGSHGAGEAGTDASGGHRHGS